MLSAQGTPLTLSPSKGERNAFFNRLLESAALDLAHVS